jgi:aspartate aminotransferase
VTDVARKDLPVSSRLRGKDKTLIRQMHDLADPSCIDLGLGELRFPVPAPILEYVRKNLASWKLGYTPNEGYPELRELIAEQCTPGVTADGIFVTIGAQEALLAVLMSVVEPGDEVLVPDPGYPAYPAVAQLAGGEPRPYPLLPENGFTVKADRVLALVTEKTKAVIINSPNNPTGAVYAGEELEKLAAGLRRKSVLAISDEVYREIVFGERPESISSFADRWAVINSLSKSFCLTGWRIGWCAVPAELAKPLAAFQQLSVTCAPAISQRAAIFALKGFADREKADNVAELRKRRDFAVRCLRDFADLSCVVPGGAFYLFVDVSGKRSRFGSSLDIALRLLREEKVVTIPGIAFGERGEGFLRLSFAAEVEDLEEGIRRLGRFLA